MTFRGKKRHLQSIANICNELLIPNELCPCGCTGYLYK